MWEVLFHRVMELWTISLSYLTACALGCVGNVGARCHRSDETIFEELKCFIYGLRTFRMTWLTALGDPGKNDFDRGGEVTGGCRERRSGN